MDGGSNVEGEDAPRLVVFRRWGADHVEVDLVQALVRDAGGMNAVVPGLFRREFVSNRFS